MKKILKNGRPLRYALWCNKVAGTDKEDYNELPPAEKQVLLDALIEEQGFICGYTMRRIDRDTAHIEHIKPQSICRMERQGSDLDYKNLIACYPRYSMRARYRYGAQKKGDWWENKGKKFVSPLNSACEKNFHFDMEGNITSSSIAAATTIEVLALDHKSLTEDRKRAIEEFIHGSDLSKAKAARIISRICDQNGEGLYYEFCIAIRDAVKHYIKALDMIDR
jgi:uncharacterized protein (TIGR02646 family)